MAHFRIHLFDPGFFRPEGRVFRGRRLNTHYGKVLCIHPNSAAVEELVVGSGLDGENIGQTSRKALVPGQSEAVVILVKGYASLILLCECLLLALQQSVEDPLNQEVGSLFQIGC